MLETRPYENSPQNKRINKSFDKKETLQKWIND